MKIQWFPGHMAKTRRLIEENLRLVDICVEIADARLVNSSRSPLLFDLINKKPRILIMNKADIADEKVNNEWKKYFESGHFCRQQGRQTFKAAYGCNTGNAQRRTFEKA